MLDWLSEKIWAIVTYVPALFVEDGSPKFMVVRAMFALLLLVLVVALFAFTPFRTYVVRLTGWASSLLTRKR